MLIIGGYAANTSWLQCDVPEFGGQHGLLLGQESAEVSPPKLQWWWRLWREFNEYRVPDKITSFVGGKCVLPPSALICTYLRGSSTTGHATRTSPLQGWATPSLSAYFKGLNYVQPRTATRPIPETSTAVASDQPGPSSPNVGAIAGGTIGGIAALIALIAVIVVCLRRRHGKKAPPAPRLELDGATARSELDNFAMAQKQHLSNVSVAERRPYCYTSADRTSTAAGRLDGCGVSAELPGYSSPASVELPGGRSPVSGEFLDANHPVSGRGPE